MQLTTRADLVVGQEQAKNSLTSNRCFEKQLFFFFFFIQEDGILSAHREHTIRLHRGILSLVCLRSTSCHTVLD